LELQSLDLNGVHEDFSQNLVIKKDTLYSGVKFSTSSVVVSGNVEQFTEGNFEVPFEIINATELEKEELTTLIKNVKVTFVIGLSDFESITKSDFTIVCDYSMSKKII
jgi:hypothetical protein